ncbi:MAG: hypothetical protein ACREJ2_17780 [Planctomycetota bacterium]
MMHRLKTAPRRLAVAALLAVLAMGLVRAADNAAAADPIPVVEVRIPHIGASVDAFKAFVNNALPQFAKTVNDQIYPTLFKSPDAAGIDLKRSLRAYMCVPPAELQKKLDGEAAGSDKFFVMYVPVSDSKVLFDKIAQDADGFDKDGDYQKITPKTGAPSYLKISGSTAVVSNTKAGVDYGVAHIDTLNKEEDRADDVGSVGLVFHPATLIKAAGLDTPEARKQLVAMLQEASQMGAQVMPNPMMGQMLASVNAAKTAAGVKMLLDMGIQMDTLQFYATFNKDACNLGMELKTVAGSDLGKTLDARTSIDTDSLVGLAQGTPILSVAGSSCDLGDDWFAATMQNFGITDPAEQKTIRDALDKAGPKPLSGFMGVDASGKFAAATAVDLGADGGDAIKVLLTHFQAKLKQAMENAGQNATLSDVKESDQDGWHVIQYEITPNAKTPEEQAAVAQAKFLPLPLGIAIITKDGRAVAATGVGQDKALDAAKAFAAGKDKVQFNPTFQQFLANDLKSRVAKEVVLFDPYPIFQTVASTGQVPPPLVDLAKKTIGTLNPIAVTVYTQNGTTRIELRLEAESIKQWVAFVSQVTPMFGGGGGPGGPGGGGMPPPPAPGQGGDF